VPTAHKKNTRRWLEPAPKLLRQSFQWHRHWQSNLLQCCMSTTRDQYPKYKQYQEPEYKIVDDQVVRFSDICVHEFTMGDVEDPDLYAAQPLYEWQQSEMGKFIMSKAVDTPEWHRQADISTYGYQYAVVAKLKEVDYTFWILKWADQVDRQGIFSI